MEKWRLNLDDVILTLSTGWAIGGFGSEEMVYVTILIDN